MEGLGDKPLTVRVAKPRNEDDANRMAQVAAGHYAPPPSASTGGVDVNAMLDAAFAGSTGVVTKPMGNPVVPDVSSMLDLAFAGAGTALPPPPPATKILVLLNMVTKDDLVDDEEYADLFADIKEECDKFGSLNSVTVPRAGEKGEGKVILEYASSGDAEKAREMLEGREFGDSVVAASYLEEKDYQEGNF